MFIEIAAVLERQRAETWSDALLEAGALSTSIEDADAGGLDEQPLYGEPGLPTDATAWRRSRVVALFDDHVDVDAALAAADAASAAHPVDVERREIADANWVALTQSQFEPIRIDERLWIVPSWHELPQAARAADAIVLRLDPGMAFGTGDHPTTRLCLEWLVASLPAGASVIDYGCGSGVLAIAAKKLGASDVVATDIDEQAVIAARANAADNAVALSIASSSTFSSDGADVVIANILSNPLKVLAPLLSGLVRPGGVLVLSGILERQWQEVAAVYAPAIVLDCWRRRDGWVCLVGRRADPG